MRSRAAAVVLALAGGAMGCCFGTSLSTEETIYETNQRDLGKLAETSEGGIAEQIATAREDFEVRYEALPTGDEKKRAEALDKLNNEMWKVEDEFEKRIESAEQARKAEAQKKADAKKWENIRKVAGVWQGDGMDLTIDDHGQVAYKRTRGASSKSIDAPITKFDGDRFEVGAFGITTTFEIDEWPHESEGQTVMKVDGVKLTLQPGS